MPPLWTLKKGESSRIVDFDSSLPTDYKSRLIELGFHQGAEVICVHEPGMGAPKVYRVSNTFYSLDDEIATGIEVEIAEH